MGGFGMRFILGTIILFSLQVSAYNIDQKQISVSGLSSGAYMAGQVHVAFSDIFMGVGIIAGGPYYCAKNDSYRAQMQCMGAFTGITDTQELVDETLRVEKANLIAPTSGLADSHVYIFNGKNDAVVVRQVVDENVTFYKHFGVKVSNIKYVKHIAAGHGFPTVDYGNDCETPRSPPFISKCNYDTAGNIFEHMYGTLKPAVSAVSAHIYKFAQKKYLSAEPNELSLNNDAFAYVPDACEQGKKCRLHVAFHGCKQTVEDLGNQFYTKTGYNEWAEANNIIVIYPQTIRTGFLEGNPNGCWDWWGYTSANYHTREAPQMKMIAEMVKDFSVPTMQLKKP